MTREDVALIIILVTACLAVFIGFAWATDPTVYPP
jgi:hypothetical protein